ncbi:MAG: Eco57I restriction-modification methylase domain-containing protein [Oscillospiraceae bacterium]|nr:Eco57I restriction-modification methylase domain-containing protein [Oscillospiraceae bacterium]
MRFDCVVGNPPYQEETKDTSDLPIYHHFYNLAESLASVYCIISPAKFLFNAGKTPAVWNKKMLGDKYLKVLSYWKDAGQVFPNITFEGGVAITYRDVNVINGPIGQFNAFSELDTITRKVFSIANESLNIIMYLQNKFDLDALYNDYPALRSVIGSGGREKRLTTSIFDTLGDVFNEEQQSVTDIRILGVQNASRIIRYINRKYLVPSENVNMYKVLISKSNGASGTLGEESARIISTPEIGTPNQGFTQSFISVGAFDSEYEVNAAFKYIKSRFSRVLLGVMKVTQDNSPDKWQCVPLQDFTPHSDIDWTQAIADIDRQLYAKYGLDEMEIAFIEGKVKAME